MILDILAVLAIIFFVVFGVKKGFIKTFFSTMPFALSIVLTILTLSPAAKYAESTIVGEYIKENVKISFVDENDFIKSTQILDLIIDVDEVNSEMADLQSELSEKLSAFVLRAFCAVALFVAYFILLILLGKILDAVFKLPLLKEINKVGGFIAGLVNAYIFLNVISCLMLLLLSASKGNFIEAQLEASYIMSWFCRNNLLV